MNMLISFLQYKCAYEEVFRNQENLEKTNVSASDLKVFTQLCNFSPASKIYCVAVAGNIKGLSPVVSAAGYTELKRMFIVLRLCFLKLIMFAL